MRIALEKHPNYIDAERLKEFRKLRAPANDPHGRFFKYLANYKIIVKDNRVCSIFLRAEEKNAGRKQCFIGKTKNTKKSRGSVHGS